MVKKIINNFLKCLRKWQSYLDVTRKASLSMPIATITVIVFVWLPVSVPRTIYRMKMSCFDLHLFYREGCVFVIGPFPGYLHLTVLSFKGERIHSQGKQLSKFWLLSSEKRLTLKEKETYSKRKEFAPCGSKFFSFRVGLFSEEGT